MPNPTRTDSIFTTNLRAALAERGMTQEALAREVGVSHRQIQKWCANGAEPHGRRLIDLAASLHKRPEWFYEDHHREEAAA